MVQRKKTGSVISTGGKVTTRRIITGIDIEGPVDDEVLKIALEVMDRLATGDVSGTEGVEVSEDIVTGLRYLDPQAPEQEAFLAEMKALRETLAELQKEPEVSAEVEAAGKSLDEAITEAEKEKPLRKMVLNRLRDTVEFMADAGKLLETAPKAGPLVAQAITTAAMLYQVAGTLF